MGDCGLQEDEFPERRTEYTREDLIRFEKQVFWEPFLRHALFSGHMLDVICKASLESFFHSLRSLVQRARDERKAARAARHGGDHSGGLGLGTGAGKGAESESESEGEDDPLQMSSTSVGSPSRRDAGGRSPGVGGGLTFAATATSTGASSRSRPSITRMASKKALKRGASRKEGNRLARLEDDRRRRVEAIPQSELEIMERTLRVNTLRNKKNRLINVRV